MNFENYFEHITLRYLKTNQKKKKSLFLINVTNCIITHEQVWINYTSRHELRSVLENILESVDTVECPWNFSLATCVFLCLKIIY